MEQKFVFNFPNPDENAVSDRSSPVRDLLATKSSKRLISEFEREKVQFLTPCIEDEYLNVAEAKARSLCFGTYCLKYVEALSVFQRCSNAETVKKLRKFEENNSDLIPGVYEGGLKVWECSLDLAQYLSDNNCFRNKPTVLELGCGVGIPGLLAYLSGCSVTFQDYNSEVLELSAIPNVYINTPVEKRSHIPEMCTFLCGDWADIGVLYCGNKSKALKKYDVILTSETIYEKANHVNLLNLMKCSLNPTGRIYLAAKTYYFGVGGTLEDFQFLLKKDGTFESSTVCVIEEGVQRKIIEMRSSKDTAE